MPSAPRHAADEPVLQSPSVRWLLGIIGSLLTLLLALSSYVWTQSQSTRDKTIERIEGELKGHGDSISATNRAVSDLRQSVTDLRFNLSLDIERRCTRPSTSMPPTSGDRP